MSTPVPDGSDLGASSSSSAERNPAPSPLQAEVSPQKESSLDEMVRVIESRIEKRTAQVKRLEALLAAWPDGDDQEEDSALASPRTGWVSSELEAIVEAAKTQKGDDERIRISRSACVNLTREIAVDDPWMTKTDALKLAKEFNAQLVWLKEYMDTMLKSPLLEAHKNLKNRKAPST